MVDRPRRALPDVGRVDLSAEDVALVRRAVERIQARYRTRLPADDGQVGVTPRLGQARELRGLLGEAGLRRWLRQPLTVDLLTDRYGEGDLVLADGTVFEARSVARESYHLARYEKDGLGRQWVKMVVPDATFAEVDAGLPVTVYLHQWGSPPLVDDRRFWTWQPAQRCYYVSPGALQDVGALALAARRLAWRP